MKIDHDLLLLGMFCLDKLLGFMYVYCTHFTVNHKFRLG